MGDLVDIRSGANRAVRLYTERVIGQAFREGAQPDQVLTWLTKEGVRDPEGFISRVEKRKSLPTLGAMELKKIGGREALRDMFGLDPNVATSLGRNLLPDHFVAYLPDHTYWCLHTRDFWAAASITTHVQSPVEHLKICEWLDQHRHVEQLSWCPGRPTLIPDSIIADGGWVPQPGFTVLNTYRPPLDFQGSASEADPWLAHLKRIYPTDADHIIQWLAHRVQQPWEKINHGIVLGGHTRIGKDTILVPVRAAVGDWNVVDISPSSLMGRFNGYLKSIILRVNEVHDLGEMNRYSFYERCKWLLAAPPEVFRVDEKNLREHPVPNVCGVIFTTNFKDSGMYLPPDDARHYVAWSEEVKENFPEDYWQQLYQWYKDGGLGHVVAYLKQPALLEGFDPKAPPPRTEAWHQIVAANRSPEESEMTELIESLGKPDALVIQDLIDKTMEEHSHLAEFGQWMHDRKNRRSVPHKLESCGYTAVRNSSDTHDGQWKVKGRRQTIYVRQGLDSRGRFAAARRKAGEVGEQVAGTRDQGSGDLPY